MIGWSLHPFVPPHPVASSAAVARAMHDWKIMDRSVLIRRLFARSCCFSSPAIWSVAYQSCVFHCSWSAPSVNRERIPCAHFGVRLRGVVTIQQVTDASY